MDVGRWLVVGSVGWFLADRQAGEERASEWAHVNKFPLRQADTEEFIEQIGIYWARQSGRVILFFRFFCLFGKERQSNGKERNERNKMY